MILPLAGCVRAGSRHDYEIQVGNDENELPPIPPRVKRFVTGKLANPESVAVLAIAAPARSTYAVIRLVDPRLRNHLPFAHPPIALVELAEADHLARRHQHVVTAEVDALRILRPLRETEAERLG